MKLKYLILFSFLSLISCESNVRIIESERNWSCLQNDSLYMELYFHDDTFECFDREWGLRPYSKYEFVGDCLTIGKINYFVNVRTKEKIELYNKENKLILEKINPNELSLEKLMKEGIFYKQYNPDSSEKKEMNFMLYEFTIRELEFLIKYNKVNRDTIIKYWNEVIEQDPSNEYYKFLIDKINKN